MLRDHHPRLVLLDLMMPVMNGWQFRREQLADAALAHIPVIVVSADGSACREATKMGAADCVQKPVDLELLLRIVASLPPNVSHPPRMAHPTAVPTHPSAHPTSAGPVAFNPRRRRLFFPSAVPSVECRPFVEVA
jgi:DNA-binding response OmpR family regulator